MGAFEKAKSVARTPAKYLLAAARWKRLRFDEAPPIFANSKPKSGSHLLLQVMHGLCQIAPYAFVMDEPVRTIRATGGRRPQEEVENALSGIPKGVIGWGYVDATPENTAILCQPGRINYFIYRDPRDTLVSQVHYATDMHQGHGMHAYYQSLSGFDERLKVAISGIDRDGLYMVDVLRRYEGVFAWLGQPHTLCLRFEDLINDQRNSLLAILAQFENAGYILPTPQNKALEILTESIQPSRSHTFRKGKTGGWKDAFSQENKELFKKVSGDLLQRLGYEKDDNW